MKERATVLFPFAIALVLPPAGLVLALAQLSEDRELGLRLLAAVAIGVLIWAFVLLV